MSDWERQYRFGQQGERVVRRWLEKQGYFITPTASIVEPERRAPSLTRVISGERVVLPDFQAALRGASRWVEVKTKSQDVYFNKTREHRQGIERRLFVDYLFVQDETGIEGHVGFLVLTPQPVKLRLSPLSMMKQHARPGMERGKDMVYWPIDLFENHEVGDRDLVRLLPAPQPANVHYAWERPAPATNEKQDYFDFGGDPGTRWD